MATRTQSPVSKWKPASEAWTTAFDEALAGRDDVERRKMFGYPAVFVNGNMAGGLHQDGLVLRLDEDDRRRLGREGGRPFEPMPGRTMREYMVAPDAMATNGKLRDWLSRSIGYAASLPAKAKKTAGSKKSKPRAKK